MSEGKILIVDDNESNLEIMAMYIESEFDNETILGSSSVDGIEALQENPEIDIVISDYYMPGGDGAIIIRLIGHPKIKIQRPFIKTNPSPFLF